MNKLYYFLHLICIYKKKLVVIGTSVKIEGRSVGLSQSFSNLITVVLILGV